MAVSTKEPSTYIATLAIYDSSEHFTYPFKTNPLPSNMNSEESCNKGEKEIYSDCKLSTFAWVELYQNCFKGDNVNGYEIEEPTEEQLAWIMRDIPGEAG